MKLNTFNKLALIASTAFFCAQAQSTNLTFKPIDQKLETQVCIVAATQGVEAAKDLVAQNEINYREYRNTVSCNGESIEDFADMYFSQTENNDKPEAQKTIKVVAVNNNVESQLCIDAVILGEKQARVKHGLRDVPVICNNKSLSSFVRSFKRQNATVKLAD